jgi:hypothetical protein
MADSMQTVIMMLRALGVIYFIAYVWIVALAFRTRVGWGMAVLVLSPIAATIYGVKYWRTAKVPFVMSTAAFVIAIGIGISTGWHVATARALAIQQVSQHSPTQKEAVTKYLEQQVATEQLLANGNSGRELHREAAAVTLAVLNATKADFPEDQWENARSNYTKFLSRSDLTRLDKQNYQSTLELVEGLQQNLARSPALKTASNSSPRAIIESKQTATSSSRAVPVSLDTPKPVDSAAAMPVPSPVPQTPEPASPQPVPSPSSRPARIAVSQAGRFIGSNVILVPNNGIEQRGRLVSAANNRLQIEERFTTGTMSISYNSSEIKSLTLAQP